MIERARRRITGFTGIGTFPPAGVDVFTSSKEAAKQPGKSKGSVTLAAPPPTPGTDPKKQEIQGVFVVREHKAVFVPVETGISGVTDIEVTKGLQTNDEIITGSYKALRTLRPNTQVKVDNSAPKKAEGDQS